MIYEMRVYTAVAGKLPQLLDRFETFTLDIWKKHGIRPTGFWTTIIGESSQDLTYMLAWDSMAERERIWPAFLADPEWLGVRSKTESDGPLIANARSTLLQPTVFFNR